MTEVVEIAKKKLVELEVLAEELRTFLAVHAKLSGAEIQDSVSPPEDDADTAAPAEIVESAVTLIREHRRPLSRSRLVKLLTEKGLNLPGADKNKNIGTVLWRSKRFDNYSGFGYWPKEFGRWIGQAPLQADMLGSNIS